MWPGSCDYFVYLINLCDGTTWFNVINMSLKYLVKCHSQSLHLCEQGHAQPRQNVATETGMRGTPCCLRKRSAFLLPRVYRHFSADWVSPGTQPRHAHQTRENYYPVYTYTKNWDIYLRLFTRKRRILSKTSGQSGGFGKLCLHICM